MSGGAVALVLAATWAAFAYLGAVAGVITFLSITGLVVTVFVIAVLRTADRADRVSTALQPVPVPELGGDRIRVVGKVRLVEPIRSPVGDVPCAAFRLTGEHGGAIVDDAGLGTFEVTADPGGDARVEAGEGTVALRTPPPTPTQVSERITQFLKTRSVAPAAAPLRLAEALLLEGEPVVVEGTPATVAHPVDYRRTRPIRILADRPGSPLIVRRTAPDGRSGT